MRGARVLGIALLLLAAGAAVAFRVLDPERRTLDDAARQAAPGQFVHLPDGITHYELAGPATGPVVVLTSGFSVPAWFTDSLFQQLGDSGFRVVRFDFLGRGWSDRPDIPYDLDLFSRQVQGLLDSLGVAGPVAIGGLSYGAATAAHYAALHPARIGALFFINPVFNNRRPQPFRERTPLAWDLFMVFRGGTEAMAASQAYDFLDPGRFPGWVARYSEQQQFRGTREAWRRTRASIAAWPDQRGELEALGRLGRPTLVVWGREDGGNPISESAALLAAMPAAHLLAVDAAAHMPHMEQAPVVVPAVVAFLRDAVAP